MERFTIIDGRKTRYLESGTGEPFLLLHAFPLTADMWRPQLAAAPPRWRLIAPDLRGLGASSRLVHDDAASERPARHVDDHAGDAIRLLDTLGIERALVGGLSMGGYVVLALLRLAPERVRGILLADTRPEADSDEARANRHRMLATLAAGGPAAVADAMIPRLLGATTRRLQPSVEQEVRRLIGTNSSEGIADAIGCLMTRPDSTPLLGNVRVPTQLIVGREDEITAVAVHEEMQRAIPDAALTVIEGAGHLSNLEAPDVFSRTLSRFLASL
jgi:pimeloyl-ACP methyl ester carboxylesterase